MAGGMGTPEVWEERAGEIQRLGKERAPWRSKLGWGRGRIQLGGGGRGCIGTGKCASACVRLLV